MGDDDDDDDDCLYGEALPFASWEMPDSLAFDPEVGFLLVGMREPDDKPNRLRAYDVIRKRIVWETLSGNAALEELDSGSLGARGPNVYFQVGRTLRALDLRTGQSRWTTELTDEIAQYDWGSHGRMRMVDPLPAGPPGAVLAITADDIMSAMDRDTGRLLWRDERAPKRITPIEQTGFMLFEGPPHELVQLSARTPVLSLDKDIPRFTVLGHHGIWPEQRGWLKREGIVVFDFVANKEVLYEHTGDVSSLVSPVVGHGRVFCATEDRERLFAAPRGKAVELRPGFELSLLTMCGPTLFVLLKAGGEGSRVLGVDPQTLAVRFDLGALTTHAQETHMCTNGQIAVVPTGPNGDDERRMLMGVDATGRVLWQVDVGEWRDFYFEGGHIVVRAHDGWHVIRPADGQIVGQHLRG